MYIHDSTASIFDKILIKRDFLKFINLYKTFLLPFLIKTALSSAVSYLGHSIFQKLRKASSDKMSQP